ncbi:MAG TPA: type II secretion system protein [Fimbriimonadaceae bacterium]|nr:type II secretion system protein [Fimbriimonadaceae bacterium]
MSKKAFTLTELLVVTAIIAMLAAYLFPVFAQAKNLLEQKDRMSGAKQTGLGLLMYMADVDDQVSLTSQEAIYREEFRELIEPYLKSHHLTREMMWDRFLTLAVDLIGFARAAIRQVFVEPIAKSTVRWAGCEIPLLQIKPTHRYISVTRR